MAIPGRAGCAGLSGSWLWWRLSC